ncbi:hypothetical protein [Vibrio cholerae]|uniref:hypothetical protein n=1 Tax=Vibrio cholerae TaxID=666 RepID=UPI0020CF87DC|nr:hypothetical protein [Vibrio cholerae]
MISKIGISKLIEPHFFNELEFENYKVLTCNSRSLLTNTRFDLAFKLLYLEMIDKNVSFSKEAYKEHIRAFSLGGFKEPGQESKNSIEKFYDAFFETFNDISLHGFDATKSLIPLSHNGSIANGAHRVASAIILDKDVSCVKLPVCDHLYDYKFFYSRSVSCDLLDIAATKFVEYADNVYIAFVWPTAQGFDEEIERIIPNIIYRKNIKMTPNGAHNLLSQIYFGEPWLGTVENNFRGSKNKVTECFKTFDFMRVIAFQADSLDSVLQIKENIRQIFNVGKHSIHITDTKDEAIRMARMIFNDNSIHFLNYAYPNKYKSTHEKLAEFKKHIDVNCIGSDDIILDSGMVLSIYGLREASDIDYLSIKSLSEYKNEGLECHDKELEYHDEEKNELIYNPKYFFYFNGLKFIAFNQLYRMKSNRDEVKDRNDCKMMESLIENNQYKNIKAKLKQSIYYEKIKLRKKITCLLKSIGLYDLVKKNI